MQAAFGACDPHIEHTLGFVEAPGFFQVTEQIISRRDSRPHACWRDGSCRCNGRHYEVFLVIVEEYGVPEEKRLIVARQSLVQPGDNDRIELQPFGFVDGHQLHMAAVRRGIWRGKEALQTIVQTGDIKTALLI